MAWLRADGVMEYLESNGVGFPVGGSVVPDRAGGHFVRPRHW